MILRPFFIPKIMENTSGNGPETIPCFCHLFPPFWAILDLLLGALFGAKPDFGLLFWRNFFRRLPPVSFFPGGAGIFVVRGNSDLIFHLFGAILPPFLLQNHAKSLPERASVSDVVP